MDEWVAVLPALALPVAALAWLTLTPQRDILETHETRARIWVGNTIAALILGLDALVLVRLWAEQSLWAVGAPWVQASFWLLVVGFAAPLALTLAGLLGMPAFYRLSLGLRPLDPAMPADRALQEETTELAGRMGLRQLLTLRRATRRAGTFPCLRPDKQIDQLADYLTLGCNLYDDLAMQGRWTGGLAGQVREGWAALTRPLAAPGNH
jgi:hypothetical protein